jgi:hypothetical protein
MDLKWYHHFPRCPDYGEGSVGTKDFLYFKMPGTALGPNQSYIQRMLGFSLRVDRPGRRADRPKLKMSGTINPLLYAFTLWTGITLHIIYSCGAPGSPYCTHGNLFNKWNDAWASSNAAKFQTNYAETVRQNRDHVVLWGGGVGLQYVCDNTFVYNKHFVQKPKWVNIPEPFCIHVSLIRAMQTAMLGTCL